MNSITSPHLMKQSFILLLSLVHLTFLGQNLMWVNGISSTNNITPYQVVVDSEDNVYEIGRFIGSADFDPGTGTTLLFSGTNNASQGGAIYITKQDANGNLIWAKVLGAIASVSETELKPAMCIDSNNNLYITGVFFQTVDFNPDAGVFNLFSATESYFVTKWDSDGTFQWATQYCFGPSFISTQPLAITSSGNNIYIAGSFKNSALFSLYTNNVPDNINFISASGTQDMFLLSMNNNGNMLNWVRTFGNENEDIYLSDSVKDLIVDNESNLFLTGIFSGTLDVNPGSGVSNIISSANQATPFMVKFNSAGNYVIAKSYINAADIQISYSPAQNTIVIGGQFINTLDAAIGSSSATVSSISNNIYNAFFCSYNNNLVLNWIKAIDGDAEMLTGITIDDNGNVYVTGMHTGLSDLEVNSGNYYDTTPGVETNYFDTYFIKLNASGETSWIQTFNHSGGYAPLFKQLVSMSNGNTVAYGFYISNAIDYDLQSSSSSNVPFDFDYKTLKAVYDRCAIVEVPPSISGPESADPMTNITLTVENLPSNAFIDWTTPDGWQIVSATANTITYQTGTSSANILGILLDECGNVTPLNYFVSINDPNNPNTGTYSFRLVKDINTTLFDNVGSRPKDFFTLNDITYFIAEEGSQLWKTDGTESGTVDVLASTDITAERIIGVFQNKLVIIGEHPTLGEEIWLSNGTSSGTMLLTEIIPGTGYPNFSTFTIGENYMYFLANNNINGQEWWVTDGTDSGTYMVAELSPSVFFGLGAPPVFLGDAIAFGAIANTIDRKDLWIIGPNQGQATNLTEQFPALFYTGLNVSNLAVVNGLLFFDFYSGNDGKELFVSDGTISGTFMYDLQPGNESAYPDDFMVLGNTIIMNAYTAQYPQGCMVFIDENLISSEIATRIAVETDYAEFNGIIYFSGFEPSTGNELWRTDGTPDGTWLISDILPGSMGSSPDNLTWCGSKLYFTANSGTLSQPHVSNGTAEGTYMLADIFNNGTVGSYAHDFTFLNGNTFFIARTAFIDFHVFKTDGSVNGTEQIFALDAINFSNPLGEGSVVINSPGSLFLASNSIWMSADYHNISKELYVIDGGDSGVGSIEISNSSTDLINVFPNPTSGIVHISSSSFPIKEIHIIDATGKMIQQSFHSDATLNIDLSHLSTGTYILDMRGDSGNQKHVMIKE